MNRIPHLKYNSIFSYSPRSDLRAFGVDNEWNANFFCQFDGAAQVIER
jgi:hypothetical protein